MVASLRAVNTFKPSSLSSSSSSSSSSSVSLVGCFAAFRLLLRSFVLVMIFNSRINYHKNYLN